MGLDQYLSVRRRFDPDSPEARLVLGSSGTTLEHLVTLARNDDDAYERKMYLSRWDFDRESRADEYARAVAVSEAAGLLSFATPESCGGYLGFSDGVVEVDLTCIYWRKANAVHAWFVEHCQDGVDECQKTPVHIEQLAHLRSLCIDAVRSYHDGDLAGAEKLMMPTSGFFFGSTDVDEWWARDLEHTVKEIERVVKLALSTSGCEFAYQASW